MIGLKKVILTISNQRGLHARAAAKFVKLAGEFLADITVAKDGQEVSGLSIMGLMMLAAAPGDQIEMTVAGDDADEALKALRELVENKFEEN
ncbi:MAG: HPr family phosphocarrier protein [Rhodospirillales bacterium]|nr:HPr family phosphocarrier protein [Rhodospirillaceae bacterium]MDP6109247.1 HPr family phosphocarrier protein [Rhodospirillales bacterium]